MPGSVEILRGLTRIAQEAKPLAIGWHLVLAMVLLALAIGHRPSRRLATLLLTLPLASVSVLAFRYGNPFNGGVFAASALGLSVISRSVPAGKVERASTTLTVWALVLLEFAWIYPHFLGDGLALAYLYAAPLGIVPCPTLAALIGFGLLGRGFESRAWSTWAGALGLLYGLFGALRLGVAMDALLSVGASILLAVAWLRGHTAAETVSAPGA